MDRWIGKVAIVTGASSGIGAAIAEKLVEDGLLVVGIARRAGLIETAAKKLEGKKGKLYAFQADMSKEEEILKAFQWTLDNVGPVHILINNAGTLQLATLTQGGTESWREVLDTNILGLCIATKQAVNIMKENEIDGHIIHINSVFGGHFVKSQVFAPLGVYPATKFAITALTETLRQEFILLGLKIKISCVSPGLVRTGFIAANVPMQPDLMENNPILLPEDVAESVKFVLATPPHVQVHELIVRPVGEVIV